MISRREFTEGYRRWFRCESPPEREDLCRLMERLDPHGRGSIDYLEWTDGIRLDNLAEITA